jgi:hypothetical protein
VTMAGEGLGAGSLSLQGIRLCGPVRGARAAG